MWITFFTSFRHAKKGTLGVEKGIKGHLDYLHVSAIMPLGINVDIQLSRFSARDQLANDIQRNYIHSQCALFEII